MAIGVELSQKNRSVEGAHHYNLILPSIKHFLKSHLPSMKHFPKKTHNCCSPNFGMQFHLLRYFLYLLFTSIFLIACLFLSHC